ncbi:MAG: putative MFS family arabinose efflux permease [Woeseiaceae bacterium]|jgi:predicted MFS family arabinose efflux permease
MGTKDTVFIDEFRRNWKILAVAFVCFLFAFSAPAFSLPFLYRSIMEEFGWSREQVTLLASAKYATGAIFSILIGRFIDVIGIRNVLISVSTLGALAMLSFLWTPNLTIYYLSGVLLGIASPGTIVAIKVLISRTFHASQGTAMGVAMLGTALGSVIVPIAITFLIAKFGWRYAIAMMSLGIWLIALPIMIFYLTDKSFEKAEDAGNDAAPDSVAMSWAPVRELMKQRQFWLIAVAVMLAAFVDQAFTQHQVLYLEVDLGMSAAVVAGGISAIGIVGFVGRIFVGGIFDKWSSKGVSLMYLVLAASCLLALAAFNPYIFAAFIVFRAVGHAAVMLDTTVLAKHTFGLANIGILLGIYTAAVNIGFMLGPWFLGRMFAVTGSYVMPFIICCGLALFAAAVLIPVKPSYWIEMRAKQKKGDGLPATP